MVFFSRSLIQCSEHHSDIESFGEFFISEFGGRPFRNLWICNRARNFSMLGVERVITRRVYTDAIVHILVLIIRRHLLRRLASDIAILVSNSRFWMYVRCRTRKSRMTKRSLSLFCTTLAMMMPFRFSRPLDAW